MVPSAKWHDMTSYEESTAVGARRIGDARVYVLVQKHE